MLRGPDDDGQLLSFMISAWKKQQFSSTPNCGDPIVTTVVPQTIAATASKPVNVTAVPISNVFQASNLSTAFSVRTLAPSSTVTLTPASYTNIPSFPIGQGVTGGYVQPVTTTAAINLRRQPPSTSLNVYQISNIPSASVSGNLSKAPQSSSSFLSATSNHQSPCITLSGPNDCSLAPSEVSGPSSMTAIRFNVSKSIFLN